jgi:cytochrome c
MRWPLVVALVLSATPKIAVPVPSTGDALYRTACAYCHGAHGQGGVRRHAPPLWGPHSQLLKGAYDTPNALRQFIQHNMPLEPVNGINPGSLTEPQATSLTQYILHHYHA